MTVIRYPFQRRTQPLWVEVPFDAFTRGEETLKVKLADLPLEKKRTLEFLYDTALNAYNRCETLRQLAQLAAQGGASWPSSEEVSAARAEVAKIEIPSIQRLLRGALDSFELRQKKESGAALGEADQALSFVAQLRDLAPQGGELGAAVLRFAEALVESDVNNAKQGINEEFEPRLAEALGGLVRARRAIVRAGVAGHKEIEGEIVDEQGEPILDEAGAPRVEPIPFIAQPWIWNGAKRPGCSAETLDFYTAACGGGLLVSLSEAVMLYQGGGILTPAKIWDLFLPQPQAAAEAPQSPAEAPFDNEGDPITPGQPPEAQPQPEAGEGEGGEQEQPPLG